MAYYVSAAKLITILQILVMIIADLVIFNREVLQRLKEVGVKLDDYKYCDLYRDYLELSETTGSRKEVMLTLADRSRTSASISRRLPKTS